MRKWTHRNLDADRSEEVLVRSSTGAVDCVDPNRTRRSDAIL
jgi:hypothetical protein